VVSLSFGATVFETLRADGADIAQVVAPAADDRLAIAAQKAGVPVHILANPKIVPGEAIAEGTGLIVAAHTHARVSNEALARSRLAGIGYHPSLLPRHRGIAAVEWTILESDPIAGGSVYHLADGWDAGAVAGFNGEFLPVILWFGLIAIALTIKGSSAHVAPPVPNSAS